MPDAIRIGSLALCAIASAALVQVAACGSSDDSAGGAGSDAGDAAANDSATVDGNTNGSDGGSKDGSATDAATDSAIADGGPSFCERLDAQPAFCDDFDHGGKVGATWDAVTVVTGSSLAFDDTISTSPPASLLVTTEAQSGAGFGTALLRKTVTFTNDAGAATNVTHARLSFSFNATSAVPTTGTLGIATLDLSLGHLFTLYLRDTTDGGAVSLIESPSAVESFPIDAAPPSGAWTRVVIDLDIANAKANVFFGAAHVLTDVPIMSGTSNEPTIRVGALLEGPAPAWIANFDDVTLEVE